MSDVLRLMVLLEASACLWFTGIVLLRYRKRFLQAAKHGTAGRRKIGRRGSDDADTDWIGLLPLHVWLVTAFTLMAVVQATALTITRLSRGFVWYGSLWSLVELSLLLAGLLVIASYENRVTGRR